MDRRIIWSNRFFGFRRDLICYYRYNINALEWINEIQRKLRCVYMRGIGKVGKFLCAVLVICQWVLLRMSRIGLLYADPSLGMTSGSCYFQWSACSHKVNISGQVLDCSIVEQRAVTQVLLSERLNPHKRILVQYGEKSIVYFSKQGVPVDGKIWKCQDKRRCWASLWPSDHFTKDG